MSLDGEIFGFETVVSKSRRGKPAKVHADGKRYYPIDRACVAVAMKAILPRVGVATNDYELRVIKTTRTSFISRNQKERVIETFFEGVTEMGTTSNAIFEGVKFSEELWRKFDNGDFIEQ